MVPRLLLTVVVAALLTACHSAQRENPFDPELTDEVVDLAAEASDSLGAVLLTWSAYDGAMPFQAYLVLRKEQGLEAIDTLAQVTSPQATTFQDTTALPERDYEYRVAVLNQMGYAAPGGPTAVRSYRITGVQSLRAVPDESTGQVVLSWEPYSGPGFQGYQVWRSSFGSDAVRLAQLPARDTSSWADTSAAPDRVYNYRLRVVVFGEAIDATAPPVSYALTPPTILSLEADGGCACAQLTWSTYDGPGFRGYRVIRREAGVTDSLVAQLADVEQTSVVDSLLMGNTVYRYHVAVVTAWSGITVESAEASGSFYALSATRLLDAEPDTEVRALDIAVDAEDQVIAAATMISTTTARLMRPGVRVHLPNRARTEFSSFEPGSLSPVRVATRAGAVYVAASDAAGRLHVGGLGADGEAAFFVAVADGYPAGIYLDGDDVVVVDQDGIRHHVDAATGDSLATDDLLRKTLEGREGLPLQDAYAALSDGGDDEIYLLAPEHSRHKVISRLWVRAFFGGGDGYYFDNGVGPGLGQSLDPLSVAYDAASQRLVVVEGRGLLQVLDASSEGQEDHYITGWGGFGLGDGQFLVTPSTAVAVDVDSQSRIHVADAAGGGGRIQTFAP